MTLRKVSKLAHLRIHIDKYLKMCMFISGIFTGKRGKIKHKYLQLEIVPSSWSEFFSRLRRSVLQVFHLWRTLSLVQTTSRLPDLKIAGPFSRLSTLGLIYIRCSAPVHKCSAPSCTLVHQAHQYIRLGSG